MSYPRRFVLNRLEDETGISGTGIVAEGVRFSDGTAVIRWTAPPNQSTTIHNSMDSVIAIHGHGGKTEVAWADG